MLYNGFSAIFGARFRFRPVCAEDDNFCDDDADTDDNADMADADMLISLTLDLMAAPSHYSTSTSVLHGKQPVKGNFNMGWTFLKTSPCREAAELTQQGHWVDGDCVHPPVRRMQ